MNEVPCQEKLTCHESRVLNRLRRIQLHLVSPRYRPTKSLKGLVAKGYVRVLPGLFRDTPQGYTPAD